MKKIFTLIAAVATAMAVNAQTIFSFDIKEGTGAQPATEAGNDLDLDENLATITGDYEFISIHNGHGSSAKVMINASGQIDLGGSGGSYINIRLKSTNTLKEGDKIILTADKNGGEITYDESKTGSDNVSNYTYTVPAAGEGKYDLYVFRGSSKPKITGVKIVREGNKVKVPVFSLADGKVSIASSTEGATIKYGTEKGAENTTYSAPFEVEKTTTFYAVASAEGLDNSDEVEFTVVKAYGTLAATFAGKELADGDPDETIAKDEVNGFVLADTDGQDEAGKNNFIGYSAAKKSTGEMRPSHYKVKGTLKITAPAGKKLVAIKVYGVANNDNDPIVVTVANMANTTGFNSLPSRATTDDMPCVEFAYNGTEDLAETTIKFSNQARVYFEIFAEDAATAVTEVAADAAAAPVKVLTAKGIQIGNYNIAGQKVK